MPAGTGVAVPGPSPGATDPPGTAARRTPIRVRPPVPGPGRPTCSSGRSPRGPPARPSTERGADQGTGGRPSVERAPILGGPGEAPFSSSGGGQDGSQPDQPDEAQGSEERKRIHVRALLPNAEVEMWRLHARVANPGERHRRPSDHSVALD